MSVAVVFDSAGTLLHTYRVAKNIALQQLLPGIETVTLTFSSPERVLVIIHVHSREVIATAPSELLSSYLVSHHAGFGISCTRKITTADEIGDALYTVLCNYDSILKRGLHTFFPFDYLFMQST